MSQFVLRTSTLEAFRRVVQTEWGDEDDLVERIRNGQWVEGKTNWQMRAGTAWHAVLAADPNVSCKRVYSGKVCEARYFFGDYSFSEQDVRRARIHVGHGLAEVRASRVLGEYRGEPVLVYGTADRVFGLQVRDAKTGFSEPDPGFYEPSLQWRAYLLIHQADIFTYDLFHMKEPVGGHCVLKDVVSVDFWRYEGMETEVASWVSKFMGWAQTRGLTERLREDGPPEE